MTMKNKLHKGATLADLSEAIEGQVVAYMAGKRGLDEAKFRKLLDADGDVRASYMRKIARGLAHTGVDLSVQVGK